MESQDKTFLLRFSLTANFPEALWEDDDFDEQEWLNEWEVAIKPGLIRTIFAHLRTFPTWEAHVRNRGISPRDEIEIVLERRFDLPPNPGGASTDGTDGHR